MASPLSPRRVCSPSGPRAKIARRRARWLLALSLALGPALIATPGRTSNPPVELRWTPLPGCPEVSTILRRVQALAGDDGSSRKIRATAVVQARRGGVRVRLQTEMDGERGERLLEAASCESLAEATALVLAVMLNPAAALAPPAPASSSAPSASAPSASAPSASSSAPPLPAASASAPVVPSAPAVIAAPSASSSSPPVVNLPADAPVPLRVQARAQAVVDGSWAPGAGIGASVGGSVHRGALSVGLDLAWLAERTQTLAGGQGGTFEALVATLRGCVGTGAAGWTIAGCALLDETRLRGTGTGITDPQSQTRWVLAPGVGLVGGARLLGPLWIEGTVEGVLAPRRYTFSIEERGEIYRTPALGGRARLGVGVHF